MIVPQNQRGRSLVCYWFWVCVCSYTSSH